VRSAVLDGVAPLSLLLPLYMARDGERAFGQLFRHCREDAACARAYPDLEARFRGLLLQLERAPAEVVAPHPVTGEQTRVRIERDVVAGNLRGLLYSAEVSSLAPLIIDRASRGDWGPFLALTSQLTGGFAKGMSRGMFFSVLCAEDAPFIREEDIVRESAGTLVGEGLARRILEACEVWPRGEVPQGYREPVASQVPVLLLSGELDPVTPPAWAEQARATLPNSAHLVVPGVGHNALVHACARGVFRTFLERGSVEGLPGGSCADAGSRPAFFVNFAGPPPWDRDMRPGLGRAHGRRGHD
jgi:pimeloyl-ACP methyl ester carboxylesterase